ncbi:uncharacterized protein si:dkey-9i23.16 [Hoplias malabaricus]|uniref:uncharacterized protein si:dkey-9i23.16 n=1 Tax=Hoplias malabaricus TaxID=27720 RepID=UPI003462E945
MTPATHSESSDISPPRLHRPFRFYDPEAVAIIGILFGLLQVLLGIPAYYLSVNTRVLYLFPIFAGTVHVLGGSFGMLCERSPSRQWLKNCLYCTLGGLLAGLSAIGVYIYALQTNPSYEPCEADSHMLISSSECAQYAFAEFFKHYIALLSVYGTVALMLQGFLSFSALKGLKKTN